MIENTVSLNEVRTRFDLLFIQYPEIQMNLLNHFDKMLDCTINNIVVLNIDKSNKVQYTVIVG